MAILLVLTYFIPFPSGSTVGLKQVYGFLDGEVTIFWCGAGKYLRIKLPIFHIVYELKKNNDKYLLYSVLYKSMVFHYEESFLDYRLLLS